MKNVCLYSLFFINYFFYKIFNQLEVYFLHTLYEIYTIAYKLYRKHKKSMFLTRNVRTNVEKSFFLLYKIFTHIFA
jgi:hypothetical protein